MSQLTDARLPLDPTQAALLVELLAIPDRPDNTWFLTKDSGVFFLDQMPSITTTVVNGIELIGPDIGLGGTFTQDTDIDGGSLYSFGITNTQLYVSGVPSFGNLVTFGAISVTGQAALALVATPDYNDSLICYDLNSDAHAQFTTGRLLLGTLASGTVVDIDYSSGDITLNWTNALNLNGITVDNALTGILCIDPLIGNVFYRDVSTIAGASPLTTKGDIFTYSTTNARLPVGTNGQVLSANSSTTTGLEWITLTPSGTYYQTILQDGTPIAQRFSTDFIDYFVVTDGGFGFPTEITLDITAIESTMSLSNISGDIDLANQVTGLLDVSNIDTASLAGNSTFITDVSNSFTSSDVSSLLGTLLAVKGDILTRNSTVPVVLPVGTNGYPLLADSTTATGLAYKQIPLTSSALSGTLPLSKGGTGQALSDPGYNAVQVWDDTSNAIRLANISGLSYDSASNTLINIGGSSKIYSSITPSTTYTATIPAGTLGTSNVLKYKATIGSLVVGSGGGSMDITITYGGATIATGSCGVIGSSGTVDFLLEGYIYANGASAQKNIFNTWGVNTTGATPVDVYNNVITTSSVNSAISQDLVISATYSNASGDFETFLVEKVTI